MRVCGSLGFGSNPNNHTMIKYIIIFLLICTTAYYRQESIKYERMYRSLEIKPVQVGKNIEYVHLRNGNMI